MAFATAFGRKFRVSLDNLTGESGNGNTFKDNVYAQVCRYMNAEACLPKRRTVSDFLYLYLHTWWRNVTGQRI